ncbi:MAG TPA: hypothetical protein VMW24_23105 [Sedimentisphaerales bacterium]|nr:hypothetical protein [Sedimentisphaerales bacterium]
MDTQKGKKTHWGCVGCLTVVVVSLCVFWFIGRRISAPHRAIDREYALTNSQFPFDAHSANALSRKQLDRYIEMRRELVPKIEAIARVIAEKRAEKAREGGGVGLVLRAAKELVKLDRELKAHHVALLNQHKMSLSEYRWVARRAFAALREGATTGRPECSGEWDRVSQGFREGAPRIAKYREAPPDLAVRLALNSIRPSEAEVNLVEDLRAKLFEPHQTLYLEVGLLTEDKK